MVFVQLLEDSFVELITSPLEIPTLPTRKYDLTTNYRIKEIPTRVRQRSLSPLGRSFDRRFGGVKLDEKLEVIAFADPST